MERWGKGLTRGRAFRIFPWVWLVAAFTITFAILALHGRPYLDSDMAAEMVLADLLNDEGGILSENWWYSTEVRVFCMQILYRAALKVFPNDWYAAHILGQAMGMLALLGSYFYVSHGLGLRNRGVWGAAALACPLGMWYFWHGVFGGFYLPHMILTLLSFGAILHLTRGSRGRRAWWTALHVLLLILTALASGLNGLKGLMAFYAPMCLAALVQAGLRWHQHPQSRPASELRQLGFTMLTAFAACAGYLINCKLLADRYSFHNYNNRVWNRLNLSMILEKWSELLAMFGFPGDKVTGTTVQLFSDVGMLGAFGLLTAAAIVFALYRLLRRWQSLPERQAVMPLLFASICVVDGLIFACTDDPTQLNASYWLPVLPFAFALLQIEGETEDFRVPGARRLAALAFCVCIVCTSVAVVKQFFSIGLRINPRLLNVCQEIAGQGYTQGYASFWNGVVMTEWTNGEMEIWTADDFRTMSPRQWLQKKSHEQPPEGEVFLLASKSELTDMGLERLPELSRVIYQDGDWYSIVYVAMAYDSHEQMMETIAQALAGE